MWKRNGEKMGIRIYNSIRSEYFTFKAVDTSCLLCFTDADITLSIFFLNS